MKILYFYQYFTTPRGSWSTRAYEFARRWVAQGHEVTVVTSVYDKSDLKPTRLVARFHIEGIRVIVLNIRLSNKHGVFIRLLTFAAYALLASWYALRLPADVVISSSGPITVGIPGLVARYVRRRRFVFEVRDLWPEGAVQLGILRNKLAIALARRFERRCYRAASAVIVLSEGMADWIRARYDLQTLHVVPNACDNDLFGTRNTCWTLPTWAQQKRLVLYTGTIGLMDDCWQIVHMAEHLHRLKRTDVDVVLIGDGYEREALEAYVKEQGLHNVHFPGLLPKHDVAQWLGHASCALLAFRAVPCMDTVSPNKLFDALAAGVPVVQATQGWIKDLLDREQCGLTVPQGDPSAMAQAVLRLLDDEPLRARLAGHARRTAHELFDRDLLASRMLDILEGVAEGA